jgi:hypothetical protein
VTSIISSRLDTMWPQAPQRDASPGRPGIIAEMSSCGKLPSRSLARITPPRASQADCVIALQSAARATSASTHQHVRLVAELPAVFRELLSDRACFLRPASHLRREHRAAIEMGANYVGQVLSALRAQIRAVAEQTQEKSRTSSRVSSSPASCASVRRRRPPQAGCRSSARDQDGVVRTRWRYCSGTASRRSVQCTTPSLSVQR